MNDALTDSDELLRRCQQGDEAALSDLVRSYQDRLFRMACRVVTDTALAEEATAQAIFKIWTRAGQWRGKSSANTWIYRLAVRTILDVQRGQHRWWRRWTKAWPLSVADRRPEPVEALAQRDDEKQRSDQLHEALRQLSDSDRALVHLYYFENRGLAEIEAILGVARETLKMRLARARQRLRSLLEATDGVC
ncbi:MAG: RNA polymerase sigma factor [Gemmataceae bacterium]|nr:RNA polymerase sigma factor [Gemmataceae bacterium]